MLIIWLPKHCAAIENDHFHQVVSDRAQSHPCRNGVLLISGYPCHKTDTVHLHKGPTDRKDLAEILGKETIDLYNTSDTRGTSQSYGLNYQKTGKELMSQDEIAVMDGGKCIMQLRGVRPFFSDKFDITRHRRYKELSDFDSKNAFDIEDYVKHLHRMKVTPDTEVDDAFDCGEVEGDTTK